MVDRRARTGSVARRPLERKAEEAGDRTKAVSIHSGFRVESGGWVDVFVQVRPLEEE